MKPELGYLILADSVVIDETTRKPTIIGAQDLFLIPPEQEVLITAFEVIGRMYLNTVGNIKILGKVIILDPEGREFAAADIAGDIAAKKDVGVNIKAKFNLVKFERPGKYSIRLIVNNIDIPTPTNLFWVFKA